MARVKFQRLTTMPAQSVAILAQQRSRQLDGAIAQSKKYVAANKSIDLRTKWENSTAHKIEQKRKGSRVMELLSQQAEALLARRRKLAGLLNAEMDMWQKEFEAGDASPAERKASLQARALELRDAREAERRAFVDEMYKLQWQTSCDDGRLLDSKATVKRVVSDRQVQEQQKAEFAMKQQAEDDVLTAQWQQRIDELEAKETEKEAYRRGMEKEIKGMLDQQVDAHNARKEALKARRAAEAREEMIEWRAAKDKAGAEELQRYLTSKERGMETREFNESRLHLRAEAAAEVRAEDLLLLNYALEKERAAEAAEQAKRDEEKATTKRYQDYLKAQMVKEAADLKEIDAMRKADEDKIWAKKEKEQQDRRDAREALWQATNSTRQEQMRLKADRLAAEEAERVSHADDPHLDEIDRLEAAKQAARKAATMGNQLGVRAQVSYKERVQRREEQEKFLESKLMEKVEKEHKERLGEMAGTVKVHFPNKHTQWYT